MEKGDTFSMVELYTFHTVKGKKNSFNFIKYLDFFFLCECHSFSVQALNLKCILPPLLKPPLKCNSFTYFRKNSGP